jgi:hypothetical protein
VRVNTFEASGWVNDSLQSCIVASRATNPRFRGFSRSSVTAKRKASRGGTASSVYENRRVWLQYSLAVSVWWQRKSSKSHFGKSLWSTARRIRREKAPFLHIYNLFFSISCAVWFPPRRALTDILPFFLGLAAIGVRHLYDTKTR